MKRFSGVSKKASVRVRGEKGIKMCICSMSGAEKLLTS